MDRYLPAMHVFDVLYAIGSQSSVKEITAGFTFIRMIYKIEAWSSEDSIQWFQNKLK